MLSSCLKIVQKIPADPVQKAGESRGGQEEKGQEETEFCEKVTGKAAASLLPFESAQRGSTMSGVTQGWREP